MKKILCLMLALVLTLAGCILPAQADTYYVYTANGGSLNLRSEIDNSVIARIPFGTRLETDDNRSTETAAYVTYGSKSGFVKWEFLVSEMPGSQSNYQPAPNTGNSQIATLPTAGDGEITVQAIGASVQYSQGGAGYGGRYSAISYDTPVELLITADRTPDYWVIDGVRYDFEPTVPKSFTLQNAWDTVIVEAVPKGAASRTLMSPDDIQAFRTGDQLIVQAIHAKLCHVNRNNYGAGGWLDWFDFTGDYINRATNQWEQGGQVTTRIRATIPKGKKISYWKFDDMYIDFNTNVTQFLVRTLNVSKVYEPVFNGRISGATAAPQKATNKPAVSAPTAAPNVNDPTRNPFTRTLAPAATPTPALSVPTVNRTRTPFKTRRPSATATPAPTIFRMTIRPDYFTETTPVPTIFRRPGIPIDTATPRLVVMTFNPGGSIDPSVLLDITRFNP